MGPRAPPIAEWRFSNVDIDVNPVIDFTFMGPSAWVPQFNPAAAVRYTVVDTLDLGVEYDASFGPFGAFEPASKEGQYVFETLDLVRWPAWRVRAGIGEGLTPRSNPLTVTTVLGHFF